MENLTNKIDKFFEKYKVNNPDSATPEYFSGAVKIALDEYHLPVLEMAKEFQVADSTINRWASGVAVPHPRLRQKVLEWIVVDI